MAAADITPLKKAKGTIAFKQFLATANFCFNVFGIRVLKEDSKRVTAQNYFARFFVGLCLVVICTQVITLFIVEIHEADVFLKITHNLSAISFITVAYFKLIVVMFLKKDLLMEIIDILELHFPGTSWEQNKYNLPKYLKNLRRQDVSYSISQVLHSFFFNIFGVLVSFVRYFIDGHFVLELQLYLWFPFGIQGNEPILFQTFFFLIFGTCAGTVFILTAIDLLYFALVEVCVMEFDILRLKFNAVNENTSKKELSDLVKVHYGLITITEKLDKLFSGCMFYNFAGSTLVLCLAGFQTVVSKTIF